MCISGDEIIALQCRRNFRLTDVMESPPKPNRLMNPMGVPVMNGMTELQIRGDEGLSKSSIEDFEGTLVDSAVSDIPGVFTEVYKAQKSSADEMSRRKQTLIQVQERLEQVEEAKEDCKSEILSVMNRIFLAKESAKGKGKLLKEIDAELNKLIVDIADKETEIESLQDDISSEQRNHDLRVKKFEDFEKEVEEYENQSEVGQQILAMKERIKALQEQETIMNKDVDEKENLLSGNTKALLQTEIENLKHQIDVANCRKGEIENKVKDEKEVQARITQDTQVSGKKHTAQMTRQKHQLRDIQRRNKQRQIHVTQLESKIARAKMELDT